MPLMFFVRRIEGSFEMEGAAGIAFMVAMFAMWMTLTVAILIVMYVFVLLCPPRDKR